MEHEPEKRDQLAAAKARLVEQLLKRKGINAPRVQEIPRRAEEGPCVLSFAQQRLWFIQQLEPDSSAYNIPAVIDLAGRLDASALERALNEIVRRHEALRTTFSALNEEPVQVVSAPRDFQLPVFDLSGRPAAVREAEARRLAREEARRPFDLAAGPLLRPALVRLSEEHHRLLLTMHHIVSDGWSMGVFVRELVALYRAYSAGQASPLAELPVQYADYAVWQRGWLRGEALQTLLDYWKRQLAGAPAVLELPTTHPRPPFQTYSGALEFFTLPASLAERLKELSRREGATLFMTLLAAFQVLLHRHTRQEDILTGTPIANRQRMEIEPLIGLFVNTLVMRTRLSGDDSFVRVLQKVRETALAAYAHQDVPFERLVEELQPARSPSHSPLFQVLFVLQSQAPLEGAELPGIEIRVEQSESVAARLDLSLEVVEAGGALKCKWEYNTDLFDAAAVRRMSGHFETLLAGIVGDPDARISDLPLLTEPELRLLRGWNETGADYPDGACIHTLFEAQARRTPGAVALVFQDSRLTYAELEARAEKLAGHLRTLGVRPETPVAVCLERSVELVVALLAVLKSGGAYVPLDPAYPRERLAFMLEDSGARVLLTRRSLLARLSPQQATTVCFEDLSQQDVSPAADAGPATAPANLAYIIYTSGSTGVPKGVAITHHSAVVHLQWATRAFAADELAGVMASTSVCFDLSIFELFAPLSRGGKVILAENALQLPELPAADEVTLVNTVPSAMTELLRLGGLPASVRTVNLAGEPLSGELVRQVYRQSSVERVWNLYGPSEDTTYSTGTVVGRGAQRQPSIGRPLANTQVHLLDKHLRLVPVGVSGELYIAGDGLARGYWRRPGLTAKRFIPDPFASEPGRRMYRTGDLARYTPEGELEYLGRADQQVKLRGFRIELGEIESGLRRLPGVRECVVAVRDEIDDRRLVAYLVAEEGETFEAADLRARLKEHLPDYMIPSAFVMLERLPLTPNGKVDRKALPAPDGGSASGAAGFVTPHTLLERQLAAIWESVLGRSPVGVADDFFALGGHSLTATRIVSRVYEELGVKVALKSLFADPTIRGLAAEITKLSKEDYATIEPAAPQEHYPVSHTQKRLWIFDRTSPGEATYNLPAAYVLEGELDRDAFEAAFRALVARHESLRTTFALVGDEPRQIVHPPDATGFAIDYADMRGLPDNEARAREAAREAALVSFDLERGPLLRARLIRLADDRHLFLFTVHHIVSDGWSMTVMVGEVLALYTAFREGRANPLPPLRIQYKDFAVWQERSLRGGRLKALLDFWTGEVGETPPVLALPTDFPRPPAQSFAGDSVQFQLGAELVARLNALAQQRHTTLFAVLLSAYNALLYHSTGQRRIILGTSVAGRNQRDLEPLIGFFVNTLPLSTEIDPRLPFEDLLCAVQQRLLAAFEHQELPFDLLVQHLRIERVPSITPVFQGRFVFNDFSYGETLAAVAKAAGLRIVATFEELVGAKFDLSAVLRAEGDNVTCNLEFRPDLFKRATIERLGRQYLKLLAQVAASPEQPVGQLDVDAGQEREEQKRRQEEKKQSALSLLKKSRPTGLA